MKYVKYKVNGLNHVHPGRRDKGIGLVYSLR